MRSKFAAAFLAASLLGVNLVAIAPAQAATQQKPAQVKVQLLHPTRPGLDRQLLLNAIAPGQYSSPLTPLPAGHWHVLIEHADWRLAQRVTLP